MINPKDYVLINPKTTDSFLLGSGYWKNIFPNTPFKFSDVFPSDSDFLKKAQLTFSHECYDKFYISLSQNIKNIFFDNKIVLYKYKHAIKKYKSINLVGSRFSIQ